MVTNLPVLTGTILSREATRGFIRFTMPGMLEEGLSGNKIMGIYREAGYRFTDSWFWDTRRDVLGIQKAAHTIQFVGQQKLPDPSKFATADWGLKTEYMFTASYTATDIDTGIMSKHSYSMKTDDLFTPEKTQDQMMDLLHKQYFVDNLHYSNMRLTGAFKSG